MPVIDDPCQKNRMWKLLGAMIIPDLPDQPIKTAVLTDDSPKLMIRRSIQYIFIPALLVTSFLCVPLVHCAASRGTMTSFLCLSFIVPRACRRVAFRWRGKLVLTADVTLLTYRQTDRQTDRFEIPDTGRFPIHSGFIHETYDRSSLSAYVGCL
jgi:hypothetical protein